MMGLRRNSFSCNLCRYHDYDLGTSPCSECMNGAGVEDKFEPIHTAIPSEPIDEVKERLFKSLDDIQKIINDAMEMGDRSVHISIVGDKVDLSVEPYKEEDEWGIWKPEVVDPDKLYVHREYTCSVCNAIQTYMHPHCPICGTKMKFPEPEGEKNE